MKNNKKYNFKGLILIIISLMCSICFIYSSIKIAIWFADNKNRDVEISDIQNVVIIKDVDESNVHIIEQEEEIPPFNPYWDYIKMNLIDVDILKLKEINNDTVGWIQVGGTNINYPFVQYVDNDYYLNHSFNKKSNQGGWIFLDYRNNKDDFNKNTIIYGHALNAGSMFGTLKNVLNEGWQNNTNNHVIKLSTETENTLWQIFSIYTIPNTSDYLKIDFLDDDDYQNFINMIQNRSQYKFDVSVTSVDKILTLSSCYINSDNRIVVHAKLIKEDI